MSTPREPSMTAFPSCPGFTACGGCKYNDLAYDRQLDEKQKRLEKLLGSFCAVSPIRGMDEPLHYRYKVHQVITRNAQGRIAGGYYAAGSHKVVTVPSCRLDDEDCQAVIGTVCRLAKEFGLPVYNEIKKTGFLRHVMVRKSRSTGEMMAILVAASPEMHGKNKFVQALIAAHPDVTSVILNVNNRRTSMVLGEKNITLFGPGYLTETLCGLEFRLSPASFFQVNPVMTEALYETAMDLAQLTGTETVIDAYCGTGTIGLIAAVRAGKVIGVELNADAVRDARQNARANKIKNAEFVRADASRFMTERAARGETADAVFLDPPRSGCSPALLDALLRLTPGRIVYISCGPESLARDLAVLTKNAYRVQAIQPFDLFPFTEHCEVAVQLCRNSSSHSMNLQNEPFEMIKNGQKTIELRLYDEKRKKVKAGDVIVFTNAETNESLKVSVLKLHRFDSFETLYRSLPLLKCGYTEDNVSKAAPSDMEQYYSAAEQKRCGVVGIEISLLKETTD